jgi:hypothetical protein
MSANLFKRKKEKEKRNLRNCQIVSDSQPTANLCLSHQTIIFPKTRGGKSWVLKLLTKGADSDIARGSSRCIESSPGKPSQLHFTLSVCACVEALLVSADKSWPHKHLHRLSIFLFFSKASQYWFSWMPGERDGTALRCPVHSVTAFLLWAVENFQYWLSSTGGGRTTLAPNKAADWTRPISDTHTTGSFSFFSTTPPENKKVQVI